MISADIKTTPSQTINVGQEADVYVQLSVIPDTTGNKVKVVGIDSSMIFNPAIIEVLEVREEPFLSGGGNTTFFYKAINNYKGEVLHIANCILGNGYVELAYPNTANYAKIKIKGKALGSTQLKTKHEQVIDSDLVNVPVSIESVFNGATITVQ